MASSVNAWKFDDQRTALHPAVDLAVREVGRKELATRDHTVRPGCQPSDHPVHLSVLTTHMVGKVER
jgi:hypothetical protein